MPSVIMTFIDKGKCVACGACVRDCVVHVLTQANGLGTCWGGFAVHAFKLVRRFRRDLKIPKGHVVGAVLLFGPPGVAYARVPRPTPMPVDGLEPSSKE